MKKKLIISIVVVLTTLILTGIVVYSNYKYNYVSQDLVNKYKEHEQKLFPYIRDEKPVYIKEEVNSFKQSVDINKLSGNDKEYIECVLKTDSLYDEALKNSILDKIKDPLNKVETENNIELLKIEGLKLIDKRDIQKIREYNKNFDSRFEEIKAQYMPTPPILVIQSDWTWDLDGNYTYVRGRVKNVGDKNIRYFEVTAEYLDSTGNVLDSDYTNSGETLRPNNMKEFEIMHKHDEEYYEVQIYVNDVRVE
jgi:hypothetical protein